MQSLPRPPRIVSKAEYYELERSNHIKYELIDWQIVALAGGSEAHSQLNVSIAALEHPHITSVYDYGHEKGLNFVVMRLLR